MGKKRMPGQRKSDFRGRDEHVPDAIPVMDKVAEQGGSNSLLGSTGNKHLL